MHTAVNYSHAAVSLRQQGRIHADFLKCPDWPDHWAEFAAAGPVYIHFRLMAAARRMDHIDWSLIAGLRDQSHSPFVNLHIAPYLHWLTENGTHSEADLSEELLYAIARRDIEQATRRFGAENVIIENAPYQDPYGTMARIGVDPVFLTRLTADTGCGFLLDLAHARITAQQLHIPEEAYVAALPVHRLREMHITGLSMQQGMAVDHFPMTEADWPTAAWAFDCIRSGKWAEPWVVTFEYGGIGPGYDERTDPFIIEKQMRQFEHMVRNPLG
jgi:uncharacterized protein